MSVEILLSQSVAEIVNEAFAELHPALQPHYRRVGEPAARTNLTDLLEHVLRGVRHREAVQLVAHTEQLAAERFHSGFELTEVQAEFNAVERAMWRRITAAEAGSDLIDSIGVLTSVVGAAKDALACTYVHLAAQRHAPHLDVEALHAGTASEVKPA